MTSLASIFRDGEYCCICQRFSAGEPGAICHRFIMVTHNYLSELVDVLAYSLLPDHFHLLVKRKRSCNGGAVEIGYRALVKEFSRHLTGGDAGGVSVDAMLRNRTVSEIDIFSVPPVIACLHIDPEKHGVSHDYRSYAFSSYRRYLLHNPAGLAYTEVFSWFADVHQFRQFHEDIKDIHMQNKFKRFHAPVPA